MLQNIQQHLPREAFNYFLAFPKQSYIIFLMYRFIYLQTLKIGTYGLKGLEKE